MSTTTYTSVSLIDLGGTPAYLIDGVHPAGMEKVYGATFLKKAKRWVLPAFRPLHERTIQDLQAVSAAEKRNLVIAESVRQHIQRLSVLDDIPADFSFVTAPFAHQQEGLHWLYNHPRAGLFFDPGLGKCKITVDLYRLVREPMLILCPSVVLRTWGREFVTHGNITDTIVVEGSSKAKKALIERAKLAPPAALIITYESAATLIQDLIQVKFQCLVLDESHRVKDITTTRTKAALMLSEGRARRVLLSGTPTVGNPLSLYAQFKVLGHYFAAESWTQFKEHYTVTTAHNKHQVVGYQHIVDLNKRVTDICLKKTQEDCVDLPQRTIIDVTFPLSTEQKLAYNQIVENGGDALGTAEGFAAQHGVLTVEDGPQRPTPFVWAKETVARLNKLEQIVGGFVNHSQANLGLCNGCPYLDYCVEERIRPYTAVCRVAKTAPITPYLYKNDARRDACRDLLEDLLANPDNKIIVWTRYLQELATLEEVAKSLNTGYVTVRGGMDTNAFENAMHAFNTDPACRLYLGQVASGIGVTLNAANYMVYYSLPWSHEHYTQSRARNYRIGQKRAVTIYRLLAEGSTDAFKAEALDQKIDIEDMLTAADYEPMCPIHGGNWGRQVRENDECRCDGSVDRIVARIATIQ